MYRVQKNATPVWEARLLLTEVCLVPDAKLSLFSHPSVDVVNFREKANIQANLPRKQSNLALGHQPPPALVFGGSVRLLWVARFVSASLLGGGCAWQGPLALAFLSLGLMLSIQ